MNDAETPKKPSLPKWEQEARDSIRSAIRRFNKPLQDIAARDANEGDTRIVVTDFLCTALGYDKFEDLTTEFAVRGEFADYGVRIDKQLVAFIEVKRVAQQLNVRHLRQNPLPRSSSPTTFSMLSARRFAVTADTTLNRLSSPESSVTR